MTNTKCWGFLAILTAMVATGCDASPGSTTSSLTPPTARALRPNSAPLPENFEVDRMVDQIKQADPQNESEMIQLTSQLVAFLPQGPGTDPDETAKVLFRLLRVGKSPEVRKNAIIGLGLLGDSGEIAIPFLLQTLGDLAMRAEDPSTPFFGMEEAIRSTLGMKGLGVRTVKIIKTLFQDGRQLDGDRSQALLIAAMLASNGPNGGLSTTSNEAIEILGMIQQVLLLPETTSFPLMNQGRTHSTLLESLAYLGPIAEPALVALYKEYDRVQLRIFSDSAITGDINHGTHLLKVIHSIEAAIQAEKEKVILPPSPPPAEPAPETPKDPEKPN